MLFINISCLSFPKIVQTATIGLAGELIAIVFFIAAIYVYHKQSKPLTKKHLKSIALFFVLFYLTKITISHIIRCCIHQCL